MPLQLGQAAGPDDDVALVSPVILGGEVRLPSRNNLAPGQTPSSWQMAYANFPIPDLNHTLKSKNDHPAYDCNRGKTKQTPLGGRPICKKIL